MTQESPQKAQFPLGWTLIALGLTVVPFVWAYLAAPPDSQFMGALWNSPDVNAYLSRMEWGRRGEWLFQLSYTSEEHPGIFLYPFYILLGKFAGLLNLPNILVFHLVRLVAGYFLLRLSWCFICRLFNEAAPRQIAFLLVCFGSGLGWLVAPLGVKDSTDLWVAESQTFFTILTIPHYAVASALLLSGFLNFQTAIEASERPPKLKFFAFAKVGLAGFLLSIIHPFLVITFGAVSGVYLLRRNIATREFGWQNWLGLLAVGLVSLPLPIYTFITISAQPIYSAWNRQNQTFSPNPIFYMLGYGLLLILAVPGAWWAERIAENKVSWQLITTWLGTTAVLLYVPLNFQRRFIEGLHLPIVLLATAGFFYLTRNWKPLVQLRRGRMLVILTSLSTLMILATFISNIYARESEGSIRPLYLYADEIRSFNWLRTNTSLKDTVIAGPLIGSYIPAYAGNRVFLGHDLETIRRDEKIELVNRFFQFKMSAQEMQKFIQENGIKYVFWGTDESRLFATRSAAEDLSFFVLQERGWQLMVNTPLAKIYRVS